MRPALLLALVASPLAAQGFDFYARGPYRPAVPRPDAVLGYAAGEQHTMYALLQRYLDTLVASAPERARIETWGRTAERRPIRALVISDPANLARLDQIRAEIAELVDPRKTTPARAADIAARDPGFTWPDNTDRLLKGTVWAVVETQGSGGVVLFAEDPLYRAFWRGTARLVSNAILIGPNR